MIGYCLHFAHKAEVTGSNPVGCVNYFNGLDDFCAFQKLPVPENFRRICSRAVPGKIGKCSNAHRRTSPCGNSVMNNGECNGTRSKKSILECQRSRAHLRLERQTRDNMRWMGTGPIFRKHGGRVYYHIDKLQEWSMERRVKSTELLPIFQATDSIALQWWLLLIKNWSLR